MAYQERIKNAILDMKDRSGSSLQKIKAALNASEEQYRFINSALKKGVASGLFIKNGGKYKVSAAAKKPKKPKKKKAKKKKVKKTPAKKGKKKKKEGPKVKRALSAYMFFAKHERPGLKEKNPELSFGELGRALGAAWSTADASTKKKYEAMAAKDKLRAEKERAALGL